MIIVADSSPFVVLVAVGHVDVLAALFEEVLIPPQVESEPVSPKRLEAVRAFIATPPSWLRVQSPDPIERIEGLHAGEAAAIALARQLRADRVIIDEALGRRAATQRGLQVIGTIGVLETAADRGFIDLAMRSRRSRRRTFG